MTHASLVEREGKEVLELELELELVQEVEVEVELGLCLIIINNEGCLTKYQ